jgi:hypothetical protein
VRVLTYTGAEQRCGEVSVVDSYFMGSAYAVESESKTMLMTEVHGEKVDDRMGCGKEALG